MLVADDEPLLRDQLEQHLSRVWPEATLVASTGNGKDTMTAISELKPDVAFLDIQMPVPNGLEIAEKFAKTPLAVVFVTAFDQYAVAAFEKNACDYLLKPISSDRLRETIDRVKLRLASTQSTNDLSTIREEIERLKQSAKTLRLPVRHGQETKLINVNDIRYFKAEAKYTLAYDATNEYVLSTSLTSLETELDASVFWRIHRNCVVNSNYIDSARHRADALVIKIKERDQELRVSRPYRHLFREI